jgi:hypothetical protein
MRGDVGAYDVYLTVYVKYLTVIIHTLSTGDKVIHS